MNDNRDPGGKMLLREQLTSKLSPSFLAMDLSSFEETVDAM